MASLPLSLRRSWERLTQLDSRLTLQQKLIALALAMGAPMAIAVVQASHQSVTELQRAARQDAGVHAARVVFAPLPGLTGADPTACAEAAPAAQTCSDSLRGSLLREGQQQLVAIAAEHQLDLGITSDQAAASRLLVQRLPAILEQIHQTRQVEAQAALQADDLSIQDLWRTIGELAATFEAAAQVADSLAANQDGADVRAYLDLASKLEEAGDRLEARLQDVAVILAAGDPGATLHVQAAEAARDQASAAVGALWQASADRLEARYHDQVRALAIGAALKAALLLASIGLAAMMIGAIVGGMVRPLQRLKHTMLTLTGGELSAVVPFRAHENEIGEIARAVEVFREGLVERAMLELHLQGERDLLERRVAARTAELAAASEAAEAGSRAKSQFLAAMSHEIRTPLNGVLGMAGALERTALSETQRSMLKVVIDSGEALLTVLNDVLDFSKIEAGRLEIDRQPFSVHEIAAAVGQLFSEAASVKGLRLELDLERAAQPAVLGDPIRIRQVLQNFTSNAVKFTAAGSVTISAKPVERMPEGVLIRFEVIDTGPGLTEEQQSRLFQTFSQADSSVTREHGGTGLGLAICRQLAQLMGGEVGCLSAPGEGSIFWLELPLAFAPQDASGDGDGDLAAVDLSTVRVLAVDDNATNRLVLKTILGQFDISVAFAENGQIAVEAAAVAPYDLILMDVHMPVKDGVTATREIRAGDGPNRDTPIIALTADAMREHVEAMLAAGMTSHVAKPIRPDQLLAAMFDALDPPDQAVAEARASANGRG